MTSARFIVPCSRRPGGMTAITGETGAGKSMLLSAIRLISGGPASSGRVSPGASEAWAQGVFAVDDRGGVAQEARDAGAVLEDGELYLSRTVPVSGRSRAVLNGKSAPRSVLESLASQLVTIHGQADQLRIAAASRQREFLDMVAGDDDLLARYRHSWDALRDLDDRLERLRHQESSARQRADYLRESIQRINRADPQPGEDEELKGRRARIENAADIAQGVSRALAALDASQVDVDADSSSASDLLNQAISSLRDIHVDGDFGELADRLESLNADLSDIVFSLSRELDGEESVEDLDAINARIHELGELTRRWGPTLQDVIAWRDKATFEVEDLDASPEKVAQLQDEREAAFDRALQDAGALSEARRPRRSRWPPPSPTSCRRWPWPGRGSISASRIAGKRRYPYPIPPARPRHGRWTRTAAMTSNSCSRRSPDPRSCRWAKALPAVS